MQFANIMETRIEEIELTALNKVNHANIGEKEAMRVLESK